MKERAGSDGYEACAEGEESASDGKSENNAGEAERDEGVGIDSGDSKVGSWYLWFQNSGILEDQLERCMPVKHGH